MKLTKKQLRSLIKEEQTNLKKQTVSEDYARGIPDFAFAQVSSDAIESIKRHLKRHISQTAKDPIKHRQMLSAANEILEELEVELKEAMENKLLKFVRMV